MVESGSGRKSKYRGVDDGERERGGLQGENTQGFLVTEDAVAQ